MEQLVRLLTLLSYEVLGMFVPGLVLVLFVTGSMAECYILGAGPSGEASVAGWKLHLELEYTYSIAVLVIASYFGAVLIQHLARNGLVSGIRNALLGFGPEKTEQEKEAERKKEREQLQAGKIRRPSGFWQVLVLEKCPYPPKPFADEAKDVFTATSGRLSEAAKYTLASNTDGPYKSDPRWSQFSLVARTLLRRSARDSLAQNFQNKYTLCLNMAYAIVIAFWVSAAVAAWESSQFHHFTPFWVPAMWGLLVLLLLPGLLHTYEYYSTHWGSIVVAETTLELAQLPLGELKEESHAVMAPAAQPAPPQQIQVEILLPPP